MALKDPHDPNINLEVLVKRLAAAERKLAAVAATMSATTVDKAVATVDAVRVSLARLAARIRKQDTPRKTQPAGQSAFASCVVANSIDPKELARLLGLEPEQLAASVGLPSDFVGGEREQGTSGVQARLRELIEIITRVEPWTGSHQLALVWYRGQGIPAFGDQTAEALVKAGKADAFRSYLDGIAIGGYA